MLWACWRFQIIANLRWYAHPQYRSDNALFSSDDEQQTARTYQIPLSIKMR